MEHFKKLKEKFENLTTQETQQYPPQTYGHPGQNTGPGGYYAPQQNYPPPQSYPPQAYPQSPVPNNSNNGQQPPIKPLRGQPPPVDLGSSRPPNMAQMPPGIPIPLDQHEIIPETPDGHKKHVANHGGNNGQMLFLNIRDSELVHQRFLIVYGQVPGIKGPQDRIVARHSYFPPLTFPAIDGFFKVMVELENGDNLIRFDYLQGDSVVRQGELSIKMSPDMDKPPLLLAVIMGRDSQGIFDAPPHTRGPGVNDLDAAVRKLRCCAYMWQAFLSEQMYRNGFGRRTIRLEEYYEPDTMARDNIKRMTARVHVVRSKRTVAEIQDKERAQQWHEPPGYKRHTDESQFSIANDALNDYGAFNGKHFIVCLSVDSHWDPKQDLVLGHAALGGGVGDRRLGVFGSHTTHAWPANAEEIAAKLLDTTKTDTRYLADDCKECGEHWRAANIGMGAFLHECGHLLTLAHTPSGIMSRGFNDYNRTFMVRTPNMPGQPARQRDEAGSHWHRTDIIRLRHHPCLRLPTDPPLAENEQNESEFEVMPTAEGLLVQNDNGITMIEIWVNDRYRNHREYTAENLPMRRNGSLPAGMEERESAYPRCVLVDLNVWGPWAGGWSNTDKVKMVLTSRGTATDTLDNVYDLMKSKSRRDHDGYLVYSSKQLGKGEMDGTRKFEAWFSGKSMRSSLLPKITSVAIRSGNFVDGFILHLSDGSSRQIGKCGGGSKSVLRIDDNDDLDHIVVRSGWYIDGLEFVTFSGRRSGWKGGNGGGRHVLRPPRGHGWVGITGSGAQWLDSITMHYAKCS